MVNWGYPSDEHIGAYHRTLLKLADWFPTLPQREQYYLVQGTGDVNEGCPLSLGYRAPPPHPLCSMLPGCGGCK
eukprot:768654-Hanusia_phi.AAC.3